MWYYCIIIFMVIMYPNFSTILLLGHIIAYCLRVFRGEFCIKNYCTFPKTHNHNIYTDKKQFDGLNKSDSNSSQLSYSNDETNSRSSLDSDTDTASIDELYDAFNALLIGMSYNQQTIDNHIIDRANSIKRYNPQND